MGMDFKIEIKPEDIEAAIVKAVVDSSLGTKISQQVNKMAQDWEVTKVINEAITTRIRDTIFELLNQPEWKNKIRAIATEKLTDEALSDITAKGLRAMGVDRW